MHLALRILGTVRMTPYVMPRAFRRAGPKHVLAIGNMLFTCRRGDACIARTDWIGNVDFLFSVKPVCAFGRADETAFRSNLAIENQTSHCTPKYEPAGVDFESPQRQNGNGQFDRRYWPGYCCQSQLPGDEGHQSERA